MNWQKIETAPKDGSIVQLRDAERIYHCVMAYNKRKKRWEGMAFSALGSSKTTWDESFVPIHEWSPL